MYKHLSQFAEFIINESCMPTICITPEELELWEVDPEELIRRNWDWQSEIEDPRQEAINTLISLAKYRQGMIDIIIASINQAFGAFAASPTQETAVAKEGAMHTFGLLKRFMAQKEEHKEFVFEVMNNAIFPEMNSETPFLRSRACWVISQYSKLDWPEAIRPNICDMILGNLVVEDIVMRMHAMTAVYRYCREEHFAEYFTTHFLDIYRSFTKVYEDTNQAVVISAVGTFIEKAGTDIVRPHAAVIVQDLVSYLEEPLEADVDDENAFERGTEMFNVLIGLISIFETDIEADKAAVINFEPILYPVIEHILQKFKKGFYIDYFETVIDLLDATIRACGGISDFMWSLLPEFVSMMEGDFFVYSGHMTTLFDSYLTKGGDALFTPMPQADGKTPVFLIYHFFITLIQSDNITPTDQVYGFIGCEAILAHHRGRVDDLMPAVVNGVVAHLSMEESPTELRVVPALLLGACFYYNTGLTASILQDMNALEPICSTWIDLLPELMSNLNYYRECTFSALGLLSLVHSINDVPNPKFSTPDMMGALLENCMSLLDGMGKYYFCFLFLIEYFNGCVVAYFTCPPLISLVFLVYECRCMRMCYVCVCVYCVLIQPAHLPRRPFFIHSRLGATSKS